MNNSMKNPGNTEPIGKSIFPRQDTGGLWQCWNRVKGHWSPGQLFWSGRVRLRVSVTDPLTDPVFEALKKKLI